MDKGPGLSFVTAVRVAFWSGHLAMQPAGLAVIFRSPSLLSSSSSSAAHHHHHRHIIIILIVVVVVVIVVIVVVFVRRCLSFVITCFRRCFLLLRAVCYACLASAFTADVDVLRRSWF